MSEKKSFFAWNWKPILLIIWKLIIGAGAILGIIGGALAIFLYAFTIEDRIDKRISEKLKDPEILSQIASHIRPSVIFDHKGIIRTDSGGKQYIKDISVEMGPQEPSKIKIFSKEHWNSAPILECINYNFDITSKRIKSGWLFELSSADYLVFESSSKKEWLFRLEITRQSLIKK